ncbi:MAG: aldolase/citrate lyase family protein [Pseudomonadota bacterium]
MRVHLRDILESDETALNAWLNIGHSFSAEIMAAQDFDALTIDTQHGPQDYSSLLPMIQAMRGYGKTIMARVPWNDPVWIMKFLDAGAMGIICPMINTGEQAAEFVSYLRYPPIGQRSWGPTRVIVGQPDYTKEDANDQVLAFAMIETAEALENLEEIAATPHLDALYIGPSDLSLGMSNGALPVGLDREEPEVIAAIQRILETAHTHGKKAALHCGTADYAKRAADWGFDMVTVGTDSTILAQGAKATIAAFREN